MRREARRQYTIRSVPLAVDHHLRTQAKRQHKSLNEVTLEALERGVGLDRQEAVFDDLDDLAGTWEEDGDFEAALKRQDVVDRKLWR